MKKEELLLVVLLTCLPLLVALGNMIDIPNNLIWFVPNLLILYIALKNIKLKNIDIKIKIYLYIFLILNLISCLLANNKIDALLGSELRLTGYITLISFVGYYEIGSRLKENNIKLITTIIVYIASVISILMIIKLPITYKMFNQNLNEYYFYEGPFNQFNHTAYYLLIASIICIYKIIKEKKIIYYILNIILIYTLIINDTFGVYVAYTITLILITLYYILKKINIKIIINLLLTFLTISTITYRNNENVVYKNIKGLIKDSEIIKTNNAEELYKVGTNRGELWINGLKIIKEHPLIGVGLENTKYEYQKNNINRSKPHNIILELTLDSGIFSLTVYILFIINIFKNAIKKKMIEDNAIFIFLIIAYLLSSMFGNITFYVTPYFYLFLGILSKKENDISINNNNNI